LTSTQTTICEAEYQINISTIGQKKMKATKSPHRNPVGPKNIENRSSRLEINWLMQNSENEMGKKEKLCYHVMT
jgi:hypothetical protein